jgi:hypothetical protein
MSDDDDDEVEAAQPLLAATPQQASLLSFVLEPKPSSVASQLLALSEQDLQAFAASRNTLKFQPIIRKLRCLQEALLARFEAMRIEEQSKASAPPPRVASQGLLAPLPQPQQMPAPPAEQLVNAPDLAADMPLQPSEAAAAPVEEV